MTQRTLERASHPGRRRDRRAWIALAISITLLLLGLWLVLDHHLVNLVNSREGHPIVPASVLPGKSVGGDLVLGNRGLLPIAVSLQPRSPAGALPRVLSVKVKDLDDGRLLYVGPIRSSMGPLVEIPPGAQVHLFVTIISEDTGGTAAVPLPLTFVWVARPALSWWSRILLQLPPLALVHFGSRGTDAGEAA